MAAQRRENESLYFIVSTPTGEDNLNVCHYSTLYKRSLAGPMLFFVKISTMH